jgi:7-carboxy-7-deazaguanine synthase
MKIKINEIFTSIDGEVNKFGQGGLTTFIRFADCNLRCSYCDTNYAQSDKFAKEMTINEIISQVKTPKVTITGGEPLVQMLGFNQLITVFLDMGLFVTVETNGSLLIPDAYRYYDSQLGWVIDFKFEYENQMIWENFILRRKGDWIKFVLDKKEDYKTALGDC